MRVKSEYVIEADERGKSVPRRVGLKEVQREGVEYEFDIVGLLDLSNTMTIEKSRMPDLTGAIVDKPDGKFADRVLRWLGEGETGPAAPAPSQFAPAMPAGTAARAAEGVQSDQQRWTAFCKEHGFGASDIEAALGTRSVASWMREHNSGVDDAMGKLLNWAAEPSGAPAATSR